MKTFKNFVPTIMGEGALASLKNTIREKQLQKVFLVYDPFLKEAAQKVASLVQAAGAEVVFYDGVTPDPTDVSCIAGANVLKDVGGVDGIIGLGGGSAMDTAKCINVLATNPEPMYLYTTPGGNHPTAPGLPLILIPTTAGTGAECTYVAVVTWTQYGNNKISVKSQNCCTACLAIVDPDMSKSMPKSVTLASGVDGLTHACEAMTVARTNPVSDALAKEAIRLIVKNLPIVCENGEDLAAREAMGNAALMAGQAFSNTLVHLGHAFGHSFGAFFHKPHGFMVGAALPNVLAYVAPSCPEQVQAIGECMGLAFADTASAEEIGQKTANAVLEFYNRIQFPTLKELGIARDEVKNITDFVCKDPCFRLSSRPMEESEIEAFALKIYDRCL